MKITKLLEILGAAIIMLIMLFAVAMLPLPTCEQRSAIEIPRCK